MSAAVFGGAPWKRKRTMCTGQGDNGSCAFLLRFRYEHDSLILFIILGRTLEVFTWNVGPHTVASQIYA